MAGREDIGPLIALINEAIRVRMVETHTALPGIVQAFHVERQTVDVKIPLKRNFRDTEGVETLGDWPLLTELPVWMPHAGGFHITLPVSPGDECLIIFTERDVSRWLAQGDSILPPESPRMHDISDGVVLLGFNTQANKLTPYNGSDLEISNDAGDQTVRMKADGTIELRAPATITLDAPNVNCTGNLTAELEVTAQNSTIPIPVSTHKHIGSLTAPTGAQSDVGLPKP